MRHKMFASLVLGLGLSVALTGCSGGGTPAASNPNYFSGKTDRKSGSFAGLYNPAGYSTSQVRRLISEVCFGGRLTGYSEVPQSELTSFVATCQGGISPRYSFVSFEKISAGSVMIEATGSNGSGNIVFTQRETKLGPGGPRASAPLTSQPAPQAAEAAPEAATPRSPRAQECKNSITIYCKDPVSGRIIPNKTPG